MPKILIVEDQKETKEFAVNFFRRYNIDVLSAESAEEALSLIENHNNIDLVLLDIKLPGMDGIELLRRIKQTRPQMRAIMVTAKSPEEDDALKRCKELGASAYIHKPLELDELKKIILRELNYDYRL
ncbi:MAG: response regulator [Candidatus Omnitrophica bacterium]|nr:response regulator [Candidatus Omnitrophota bacterium]